MTGLASASPQQSAAHGLAFSRYGADRLFLIFAGLAGLILVALIPPVAGGNERFNFQRVAGIAAGHPLIEAAQVPAGVVKLLEASHRQFPQGRSPPYDYSRAEFGELAQIPLEAERPATLAPNPIAILNPLGYVPQVLAYWAGAAFGASPLTLFYLGRVAGLLTGLSLTFAAIRAMPQRGVGLAAIALLPPIVFARATLDADQVTNGLTFLFVALVLKAASGATPMTTGRLAALAAIGFCEAQCKTAYFVLLPLALAIPPQRYGSRVRWLLGGFIIIAPGLAASLAWMLSLKHGYFAGMSYHTWAGDVNPDAQTAAILADPLGFLGVLLRTVFATPFLGVTLIGLIGVFGPPVMLPLALMVLTLLALVLALAAEGAPDRPPRWFRALSVLAFFAGAGLILTLLYVQWTGVGAPTVLGFSGRYLFPLLPALLTLLPRTPIRLLGVGPNAWFAALGALSLIGVVLTTYVTYWA